MMLSPRLPDRVSPGQRPLLVVNQVTSTDEMRDGHLAWPVMAYERGEVTAIVQDTPQHVRHLGRRQMLLKHGTEAGQVNEHGLAIAAVASISGMLRHVCVDDDAMGGWISEPEGLVCLDLPKELPTAGGARDILVHWSGHVGHSRSALRTPHG